MSDDMIEESVAEALRIAEGCSDTPVRNCDLCASGRRDSCIGMARAAISAHLTALSASGYVVVKREESVQEKGPTCEGRP